MRNVPAYLTWSEKRTKCLSKAKKKMYYHIMAKKIVYSKIKYHNEKEIILGGKTGERTFTKKPPFIKSQSPCNQLAAHNWPKKSRQKKGKILIVCSVWWQATKCKQIIRLWRLQLFTKMKTLFFLFNFFVCFYWMIIVLPLFLSLVTRLSSTVDNYFLIVK